MQKEALVLSFGSGPFKELLELIASSIPFQVFVDCRPHGLQIPLGGFISISPRPKDHNLLIMISHEFIMGHFCKIFLKIPKLQKYLVLD